jgi:hypothetical protein
MQGIQSLAAQLAPGGLMHVFVYAELGRWEIRLMQEAIALLQDQEDYREGVKLGRELFETLPENNRLVKRERERWCLDNQRDECFADMYLHPQEIDFNLETLFELIDASGLEFVGFSNPQFWQLERLLGKAPQLLERAKDLPERDRYRLIERLDPDMAHYEFFLARPPLTQADWSSDKALLAAIPERHPCIEGWPSRSLFNYDYQIVNLSESELEFLQACDANPARGANVQDILAEVSLDLERVRALLDQQLIILTPA